jgi:hypothetical protein
MKVVVITDGNGLAWALLAIVMVGLYLFFNGH